MPLNISIVGYGKMGQLIESCAREKGIAVVSTIDPKHPGATHKKITAENVRDADACICFTVPDAAIENITELSRLKKNIIMATTGWVDQMDEVRDIVQSGGNAMLYSSNFSLGINLFFRALEPMLRLFNQFDNYDIMGWEMHHNRKIDAPSGTAKTIESIILKHFTRKKQVIEDRPVEKMPSDALHFASIRGGDIPGTHAVRFDSSFDSVEFVHTAKNRDGFAYGALRAAEWIQGKTGLFTETDLIDSYLNPSDAHGK